MLRSLWLLVVYLAFMGLGIAAPFVATLGYVWVDTFQPQMVAYIVLNQFPVALVMGAMAFGSYLLLDRRSPPPLSVEATLHMLFLVWAAASILWAVRDEAFDKWDVVIKTLGFTVFIPYVIRSRVQIEAFVTTYVFSLAANFVPFGLKTMLSGGGYGMNLGLQGGNGGLAEGGLLSTFCLMAVPLTIFLGRHGQLIPRVKFMPLAYWAVAGLAVVTAIGTYERSALVGLVVLLVFFVAQSRHKIGYGVIAAAVVVGLVYFTSNQWVSRISTIHSYEQEGSAYTRLQVWRWTMQYVSEHPFGGGFMAHLLSIIELPGFDGGPPEIVFGRAFHSIYFEVLGELGFPGLALYLAIGALVFVRLFRVARRTRAYPELEWVWSLAKALQTSLAVYLTAGAFVGIAFQPMFWNVIAVSISLSAYLYRVERGAAMTASGWRAVAANPAPGWRNRPAATAAGSASRLR